MVTTIGTNITLAASILANNQLVAIPTETVYGLAANALSSSAVSSIFEVKKRPFFNPLIVHVSCIEAIEQYAEIDTISLQLAQRFMPGPFTLLLPKKNIVPDIVTAGSSKVAIRVPNHGITLSLLQQLPFPIAAPSANIFGYVSPTTAEHVFDGLQNAIPYILDGGPCAIGVESTIVEVVNDTIIVHRTGGISVEEIKEVTNKKIITLQNKTKETPETPGQLMSHYATTIPLIIGDNIEQLIHQYKEKRIAIISLSNGYHHYPTIKTFPLSIHNNLKEAAANLFATMRLVDALDVEVILAEIFPQEGLGLAINDRLQRAQHLYKPIG